MYDNSYDSMQNHNQIFYTNHMNIPPNYIIENPKYYHMPPKFVKMDHVVGVYNNGSAWRIIPMDILKSYPIVYDKIDNMDASVTFCPFTFAMVIYKNHYVLDGTLHNHNIVLKNNKRKLIQATGKFLDGSFELYKWEFKLMTLRNAMIYYPDSVYLNHELSNKQFTLKMPLDYPKKVIHGIHYHTNTTKNISDKKQLAIVGKEKYPFDIEQNGTHNYLNKMDEQIREKGGFITPMYLYFWQKLYPETKIINL